MAKGFGKQPLKPPKTLKALIPHNADQIFADCVPKVLYHIRNRNREQLDRMASKYTKKYGGQMMLSLMCGALMHSPDEDCLWFESQTFENMPSDILNPHYPDPDELSEPLTLEVVR